MECESKHTGFWHAMKWYGNQQEAWDCAVKELTEVALRLQPIRKAAERAAIAYLISDAADDFARLIHARLGRDHCHISRAIQMVVTEGLNTRISPAYAATTGKPAGMSYLEAEILVQVILRANRKEEPLTRERVYEFFERELILNAYHQQKMANLKHELREFIAKADYYHQQFVDDSLKRRKRRG